MRWLNATCCSSFVVVAAAKAVFLISSISVLRLLVLSCQDTDFSQGRGQNGDGSPHVPARNVFVLTAGVLL